MSVVPAERSAAAVTQRRHSAPVPRRRTSGPIVLAFVLPTIAVLAVFRLWPVVQGVYLSFTAWDGFTDPTWIGLDNFTRMTDDPIFSEALGNSLVMALAIPVWVVLPLVLAVLIHDHPRSGRWFKLIYMVPTLMAPAVLGSIFGLLLAENGPFNSLLRAVGLGSLTRAWLVDVDLIMFVVVATVVWATFGIGVLFYSAGLAGADPALYEAASLDGATWWQRLWHITLPLLRPVMQYWTVIVILSTFTAVLPFVFTISAGGPGNSSTTLDYYIYQLAFRDGMLGYASAIGMLVFVFVLAIVLTVLRAWNRNEEPDTAGALR